MIFRMAQRAGLLAMLLGVAGCTDDLERVMTDEVAVYSEWVDRLMFVVDEKSALDFNKYFVKAAVDKLGLIEKRQMDHEANLERVQRGAWNSIQKWLKIRTGAGVDADIAGIDELSKTRLTLDWIKDDMVHLNVFADVEEKDRAGRLVQIDKAAAALPSTKALQRYLREKMAYEVCLHREIQRLRQVIEKLNDEGQTVTELEKAILPIKK